MPRSRKELAEKMSNNVGGGLGALERLNEERPSADAGGLGATRSAMMAEPWPIASEREAEAETAVELGAELGAGVCECGACGWCECGLCG